MAENSTIGTAFDLELCTYIVCMRLVFPSALCPGQWLLHVPYWPLEPTKRNLKRGKGLLALWAALALRVQGPGWTRPQCGNSTEFEFEWEPWLWQPLALLVDGNPVTSTMYVSI